MKSYLLDDYNLTCTQSIYSCLVSEIGLKHLKTGWKEKEAVHIAIGLLELIPLFGLIATIFEKAVASQYQPYDAYSIPARFIRSTVVKTGSQNDCSGAVEVDKAKKICERLNQVKPNGIYFSDAKVDTTISGGTCSAMSFDFANRYMELRKNHTPDEIINLIGSDYERSSQAFRTTQAAFNTIGKAAGETSEDFKQAKIDAMLHLHNRKVILASEPFDLKEQAALTKIRKILREFTEGVFIVRVLLPKDNEKEENFGHSTVLIRDGDRQLFYDPFQGVLNIEKGFESTTLCSLLMNFLAFWEIHAGRIYQIA